MLGQVDAAQVIQILASAVPLAVGGVAFVYRLLQNQDEKVNTNTTRTTVLETKVAEHRAELTKGDERFEGVATKMGSLETTQATMGTQIQGLTAGQTRIERKVDKLLDR